MYTEGKHHQGTEQREPRRGTLNDRAFRERISTPEAFKTEHARRPRLLALERAEHNAGGQNVLEHTRQVLLHLRTDGIPGAKALGTTIEFPDLLRMVALYHDLDKVSDGGKPLGKKSAMKETVQEIRDVDPSFFETEADEKVFRLLLQTCDYFGYNLGILEKRGDVFRREIRDLLEKRLLEPIEALAEEGINLDPEDVLRLQYELSRADTSGIERFKKNVGLIDRFYEELVKALSY